MNYKKTVRVRFAPSPTGYLHIGGARTALFNWLFARHHQGKFILRIEDTDKARSEKIYLDQIVQDMQWLGLNWDEGPYFQSERAHLYREQAEKLVAGALAFREGEAIILNSPGKDFQFQDLIRGEIKFEADSLKEEVLIKSDGTPTYNFACCLDDHDMGITHVIRGEDHIPNTPKQLAIYQAMKMSPPEFVHIPLIVTEDRSRLSKRKGAKALAFYKEQGYLPEALFNFLALLGWAPGDDREMFTQKELVKEFSLSRVGKAAAYFNPEKLEWMNGQYIQTLDIETLAKKIVPYLSQKGIDHKSYAWPEFIEIVKLFNKRLKRLDEFPEAADFFFTEKISLNQEAKDFLDKQEKAKDILSKLSAILEALESFDLQSVESACRQLIAKEGIKAGELIHPTRVALTGKRKGPGLFELMVVLGKQRILKRLNSVISTN